MLNDPGPSLTTKRLRLRCQTIEDFQPYAAFMASSRSVGLGGPYDVAGAWWFFCHDLAQWRLFGHGALMIDLLETGECIGQVGINHGPLFPEKELGWFLYDGFEGYGYATEAAFAFREWAFSTLRLPTLVSYILPDNIGSKKVAERLNGNIDPLAERNQPDLLVYRYSNLSSSIAGDPVRDI